MSDKDNFDIDDELARSLERLVEEETNVAKAAYSEDKIKAEDIKKEPENINLGATQMVDKDKVKSLTSAIKLNDEQDIKTIEDTSDFTIDVPYVGNASKNTTSIKSVKIEDDENDWDEDENLDESKTVQKTNKMNSDNPVTMSNQTSPEDGKNKKELDKKSKLIIAGACGIAALVVIIIIVIAVNMNSKNKKSYKYNLEKGTQYYNTQDYDNAVTYLTKAYNTNDGKKNADMMYELADALVHVNQNDKAIEVLKSALSYDKMNEKALPLLAKLYQDEKKGTELSELIKKYKGTKNEALLSDYKVDEPTSSENPGSFEDSVEINLMASDGCTIYYTTDGSEPTTKSSKYSSAIKIEKDDVTVKAIAVNSIGVASDVAEFKYSISLKAPDAPVLNPSESDVKVGTKIVIEGLADDEKAYYTLNGSTPSANSSQYSGGITLDKAGNYVVSVIVINKHNLSSPVTRVSYNVSEEKTYTKDEAESILMKRFVSNNKVSQSGTMVGGGGTAKLVYQNTTTISGTKMYYIRLDVNSGNSTKTEGYYGVGVNNGQCYVITDNNGSLSAVQY
jgi:tetratricopeptide (TPR) repeat protein